MDLLEDPATQDHLDFLANVVCLVHLVLVDHPDLQDLLEYRDCPGVLARLALLDQLDRMETPGHQDLRADQVDLVDLVFKGQ